MIKLRFRRNLIYLFILHITYNIRKILSIVIERNYILESSYLFLFMMAFAEFMGGFTVYIYQCTNLRKKKEDKYFAINIIHNRKWKIKTDNFLKIFLLIIFAGFFDFTGYLIPVFCVPKISVISPSIKTRIGCVTTITSSLICAYALKFKIGRHQKFSLKLFGICFFLTFILEIITKEKSVPLGNFIFAHFLIIFNLTLISFNDCIERYLAFYNFLNPFFILAGEGLFEFIMSIFFSLNKDPFNGLRNNYKELGTGKFTLLIVLLIIHFILSAIINSYKVYCNVIYNPIARSLAEYFLNPLFNIYYYVDEDDFHKNILYFIVCEILNIIIEFFFYVHNEYIILYCCGLEHDTHDEIFERSISGEVQNLNPENIDEIDTDSNASSGKNELSEIYN